MKIDEAKDYIQSIGEWVLDEDKIVTYKWLSKTLSVHVNTAKQLLFSYLTEQNKKTPCRVTATWLLAGKSKDGNHCVKVVNQDDLKSSYDDFDEITAEHVYSIQKIQPKDIQILYAANESASNSECLTCIIKCSKSFLRLKKDPPSNSLQEGKGRPLCKSPEENETNFSKRGDRTKDLSEGSGNCSNSAPVLTVRESSKEKKAVGNSTRGGTIANFFSNAVSSKKSKPKEECGNGNENEITVKIDAAKKSEKEKKAFPVASKVTTDDLNTIPEKQSRSDPRPECPKKTKKVEIEGKKRKRIKVFSDSEESENESSKERSPSPVIVEEVEVKSEAETESEIAAHNKEMEERLKTSTQNKRKKRKIVDKTVMSEDGYIETKKEVVYETDSENESEEKPAEEQQTDKVPDASKSSSPRKKGKAVADSSNSKQTANSKKQSSLYSFFKKT